MNYKKYETYRALRALSIADAAGENEMKLLPPAMYKAGNVAGERGLEGSFLWPWTDDTHLAIGVTRTLFTYNTIVERQKELAIEFAKNFREDKQRGYGRGTHGLLSVYQYDVDEWEANSRNWWGPGKGSIGNGSAMRDAVIGAQFGNYGYDVVAAQAKASAEVTHWSDPAIAGSIAVAVAAAVATYGELADFWTVVLANTPTGELRDRIEWASEQDVEAATNWSVASKVGNGKSVLALDTVPYALWQAYYVMRLKLSFAFGVNSIIEVGGDTDTVAAIYGGIIGNHTFPTKEEDVRTEPLPEDLVVA